VDYLINELGLGEMICMIVHTLYVDAQEVSQIALLNEHGYVFKYCVSYRRVRL
jgi:hypothetical protein